MAVFLLLLFDSEAKMYEQMQEIVLLPQFVLQNIFLFFIYFPSLVSLDCCFGRE